MSAEYQSTIKLQSRHCDFTGHWKPSDIFMTLQELAGSHSDLLGFGDGALRPRSLAFVITRSELHMTRYPVIGETVVLRTWAAPPAKWLFPRYYMLESESGERLGMAATLWVLMDLTTRRMAAPNLLGHEIPAPALPMPMNLPARALPVESETMTSTHIPLYEEIDLNGHVNNTRYLSWICNALGVDVLREKRVSSLSINYAHEILPGQEVTLHTQVEAASFRMSGEVDGVTCFSLSGTLE